MKYSRKHFNYFVPNSLSIIMHSHYKAPMDLAFVSSTLPSPARLWSSSSTFLGQRRRAALFANTTSGYAAARQSKANAPTWQHRIQAQTKSYFNYGTSSQQALQQKTRSTALHSVAAVDSPTIKPRVIGDVVSGFELTREEYVKEVSSTIRLWKHLKTGAELLSVLNNDENKVFGATLRTTPSDSTGVPHILEHSVLCGSEKYPVKEPFVELIKSSLNTFLNAMTFPDKTCYPVASCNEQDFYNLIDVYLDAVFNPRLTPDVLRQEGHHFELEAPDKEITIKGVVYNEMKGAYSDPARVLAEYSQRSLFPDTTYGVESGGHPRDIPDLTWEQFKGFHEKYYHPSNTRLYFYGDDDEVKRLAKTNEFLQPFDQIKVDDSRVTLQSKWDAPRSFAYNYDAGSDGDLSKKYMGTLNWMLPAVDQISPQELLAANVLSHILMSQSSSPLFKALVDSEIGDDVVGGGLEDGLRQMTFSIGLKGMKEDGFPQMEKVVYDVLNKAAEEGFPKEMIESSLNTIEFSLRENNTGSFPRGLLLMLRSMTTWLHDCDPLTPLKFEQPLAELKQRLANGEKVFEKLIQDYLLHNTHKASVLLRPDPEFAKKEDELEKKRIENAKKGLTEEDLKELAMMTQRLKEKQAKPDDPAELAKIPCLKKEDMEKKTRIVPYELDYINGVKIYNHTLFTNGVIYIDIGFDMTKLPVEVLPLTKLFSSCLTENGTKDQDFVSLQQEIGRETGGIRTFPSVSQVVHPSGKGPAQAMIMIRGKSMLPQVEKLLDITRKIVLNVDLTNKERFKQLLIEEKAGLEASIAPSGHAYAFTRLRSKFRSVDWANEQMGGVSYLYFLRQLTERVENNWESVVEDLKLIQRAVLNKAGLVVNVTADSSDYARVKPALSSFIGSLSEKSNLVDILSWNSEAAWNPPTGNLNEAFIVPAQVNYVGKAANLWDMGFEPTGGMLLASKFLGTSYLWETVRVQGGAYGGFCRLDPRSGTFAFLSYRDPNINATIKNYDGAAEFLKNYDLTEEELSKSVIGQIGEIDSYQLPDAKGYGNFLRIMTGYTDEMRQKVRDEILSATKKDFVMLGEALEEVKKNGTVVVVGSEEALKKASAEGLDVKESKIFE